MDLFRWLRGNVTAELVSGDIPATLREFTDRGFSVFQVREEGELTVTLEIPREEYEALAALCDSRGDLLTLRQHRGFYRIGKRLQRRPLLLGGLGALLLLSMFLPKRILFVRVEGNRRVPDRAILETAESCGVRFGAVRRELCSERIKNELLRQLPQLQWAGVNTAGCVATISVREKGETEVPAEPAVSSIVAACDGIVVSGTVTAGSGQFQVGQAVSRGQVLISGYTDLGLTIRAERASGEVYARTRHVLASILPSQGENKGEVTGQQVRFGLILGKKRINFWKGSGICAPSCDRIYEAYTVTLPGGFSLPLILFRETIRQRDTSPWALTAEDARTALTGFSQRYLTGRIIGGRILENHHALTEEKGAFLLESEFLCVEMIGREREERMGETYGEKCGTRH